MKSRFLTELDAMTEFVRVTPDQFDEVIRTHRVRDEHEFLESRFLDRDGQVVAKVVREADEAGNLIPEALLMVADYLLDSQV